MRERPATIARAPVRSLWAGPSLTIWMTCIDPFVTASTPKTKAIAARKPGRKRGKARIAPRPAVSAIAAASACWLRSTPGCRLTNASSSAWTSARDVAPRKTRVSQPQSRIRLARTGALCGGASLPTALEETVFAPLGHRPGLGSTRIRAFPTRPVKYGYEGNDDRDDALYRVHDDPHPGAPKALGGIGVSIPRRAGDSTVARLTMNAPASSTITPVFVAD